MRALPGIEVDGPHTNMVFVNVPAEKFAVLAEHLHNSGIRIFTRSPKLRLVLHRDIDDAGLAQAIAAFSSFSRV